MPKRGYTPEDHRILNELVGKHGTEWPAAWKAIEKSYNGETKDYPRTAGALRTEYFRHTQLRGVPKKDKTIQGVIRKLGILDKRLSRRSAESEKNRNLRKENRDLKRSKRALEAELGKVQRALRPFQRAIERAQSARVVHSEAKR